MALASETRPAICFQEIVALEQERCVKRFGERVGEAIAEIEPGGMAAAPVGKECSDGEVHLLDRYGHMLELEVVDVIADAGRLGSNTPAAQYR
jgi:hypothetical protein